MKFRCYMVPKRFFGLQHRRHTISQHQVSLHTASSFLGSRLDVWPVQKDHYRRYRGYQSYYSCTTNRWRFISKNVGDAVFFPKNQTTDGNGVYFSRRSNLHCSFVFRLWNSCKKSVVVADFNSPPSDLTYFIFRSNVVGSAVNFSSLNRYYNETGDRFSTF